MKYRLIKKNYGYETINEVPTNYLGSIIVWWFGGFGLILDAEYGFLKEISAVYRFFHCCAAAENVNKGVRTRMF